MREGLRKLWTTEDYWAVWLGLGTVVLALPKGAGLTAEVPLGGVLSTAVFSPIRSNISRLM